MQVQWKMTTNESESNTAFFRDTPELSAMLAKMLIIPKEGALTHRQLNEHYSRAKD